MAWHRVSLGCQTGKIYRLGINHSAYIYSSTMEAIMPRLRKSHYHLKLHIFITILPIVIAVFPRSAPSAEMVSGTYISAAGTQIVLQLRVQSPSPLNIIVEQFFSADNEITGTRPAAKKISRNGRETKWLLKKIGKGSVAITTTLARPARGNVSAVIRYGSTRTGKLTELRINP